MFYLPILSYRFSMNDLMGVMYKDLKHFSFLCQHRDGLKKNLIHRYVGICFFNWYSEALSPVKALDTSKIPEVDKHLTAYSLLFFGTLKQDLLA